MDIIAQRPIAIVDIGSNSVRLVVYSGLARVPSIIFNEKVMAGLGSGVGKTGELTEESQQRALAALARYRVLVDRMEAAQVRVVATAAVRDASNGEAFLSAVRALGFAPEVIPGEEEGRLAGQGVLSSIPGADGLVGDLGGGSLELVDVAGGAVRRSASLQLGVLRLGATTAKGENLAEGLALRLRETGLAGRGAGRPFYMVGGSWRALARFDMALRSHPLPITHQYEMAPRRPRQIRDALARLDKADVEAIPTLSRSRVSTLPAANTLLQALVEQLRPSRLVVSSFGIREGLLYDALDPETRARDPLIEAARDVGSGLGRFAQHGDLIDRWIAPVFDDGPDGRRLRLAACLLSDIAWSAHPEFRAERGLDLALHGNWVGIDLPGRVMLAQALFSNFGGDGVWQDGGAAALCGAEDLMRASRWGLAIRLAQRLSGGVAVGLERSSLARTDGSLRLLVQAGESQLLGESVERRLKSLASALKLRPDVAVAAEKRSQR